MGSPGALLLLSSRAGSGRQGPRTGVLLRGFGVGGREEQGASDREPCACVVRFPRGQQEQARRGVSEGRPLLCARAPKHPGRSRYSPPTGAAQHRTYPRPSAGRGGNPPTLAERTRAGRAKEREREREREALPLLRARAFNERKGRRAFQLAPWLRGCWSNKKRKRVCVCVCVRRERGARVLVWCGVPAAPAWRLFDAAPRAPRAAAAHLFSPSFSREESVGSYTHAHTRKTRNAEHESARVGKAEARSAFPPPPPPPPRTHARPGPRGTQRKKKSRGRDRGIKGAKEGKGGRKEPRRKRKGTF